MAGKSATVVVSQRSTHTVGRYRKIGMLRYLLVAPLMALVVVGFGIGLGVSTAQPFPMIALSVLLIIAAMVWKRPIFGIYLLVAGTVVFEAFRLNFPDSFTDTIPFFQSFANSGLPLPLFPVELLMLAVIGIIILKRIATRATPLQTGPLFWAGLFFSVMVLTGVIHGIMTGGEFSMALWEARAQFYLFLVYLAVYNLVETRTQVRRIMWVFLAGIAFKGIVGSFRFVVILGLDASRINEFTDYNSLLAHEESYFFAMFLAFIGITLLLRSNKSQLFFTLVFAAPVMLAFLANQRRAGTLALILAIMITGFLVFAVAKWRRKQLALLAILAFLLLPPYVVLFGESNSLIAQPAHSIASLWRPSDRDSSSNVYRDLERENLKINIVNAPIVGQGYGKPIPIHVIFPDLTSIFDLWAFIPHDTIFWVWMRLGIFGFIAFWFWAGRSVLVATHAAVTLREPYHKGIAILTVAMMAGWLAIAVVDMGLVDFRSTVIIGAFTGLAAKLPLVEKGALERRQHKERRDEEEAEVSAQLSAS